MPTQDASKEPPKEDAPKDGVQVITITKDGGQIQIITQTIIYRPTGVPASAQQKKSNAGAIAGGVVGGLAVLAAVVGGVLFLLWRRRQQRYATEDGVGVRRNTSTMSKSGLIHTEKVPKIPSMIATNTRRSSRMMQDSDPITPISVDRRSSRPFVFDQRLNPSAIMSQDNGSMTSFVSIDDSRDYGRTLNVRVL